MTRVRGDVLVSPLAEGPLRLAVLLCPLALAERAPRRARPLARRVRLLWWPAGVPGRRRALWVGRGHPPRGEVGRGRVRVGHRGGLHVWGRVGVHELMRRGERVGRDRPRGVHHGGVGRARGRGRGGLGRGTRGGLALAGRTGWGLGDGGRVVAQPQGLEGAGGLGLGRGVVEGIGVGRGGLLWGLLLLLLLLLLRRRLLEGGGWVSQHGQYAGR